MNIARTVCLNKQEGQIKVKNTQTCSVFPELRDTETKFIFVECSVFTRMKMVEH